MRIQRRQLLSSFLAETFIYTIYILHTTSTTSSLVENKNFDFTWCTNRITQTTMNTTLTATFRILAKKFMHPIYNLQCQQPVHGFKVKTLISLSPSETTQATIFWIDNKNILT